MSIEDDVKLGFKEVVAVQRVLIISVNMDIVGILLHGRGYGFF
jgi:hypothetical protein